MSDYVFLEDLGRKVGDWGKEIAKGKFVKSQPNGGRGRGNRSGNGGERGGNRGRGGGNRGGRTRRDVLKIQLESRDIDIDLLPLGMERQKFNQSFWDFKCVILLLPIL